MVDCLSATNPPFPGLELANANKHRLKELSKVGKHNRVGGNLTLSHIKHVPTYVSVIQFVFTTTSFSHPSTDVWSDKKKKNHLNILPVHPRGKEKTTVFVGTFANKTPGFNTPR